MSPLELFCEKHNITITSSHLEIVKPNFNDHEMDKWSCVIHYQGRSELFFFYTSLGSRKLAFNVKEERGGYYVGHPICRKLTSAKEVALKGFSKPVNPSVADVL